jgi:hypothetical protein
MDGYLNKELRLVHEKLDEKLDNVQDENHHV